MKEDDPKTSQKTAHTVSRTIQQESFLYASYCAGQVIVSICPTAIVLQYQVRNLLNISVHVSGRLKPAITEES